MSTHLKAFTLFAILIASIGGGSAFAQAPSQVGQMIEAIVVTTDMESYADGDTVIISGEVRELLSGTPVTLRVVAANGNIVGIEQLTVSSDKTFSIELSSGGPLWRSTGEYSVFVQYGTQSRTAETTFEFGGSSGGSTGGTSGPRIEIGSTGTMIGYTITGGNVIAINEDFASHSLIVSISTTSDGELQITLPRNVIDAKTGDSDDTFFVLIDGEEADFDESKTSTDRTLTILFPDGAEEIEIIGTFVIPEFGTIAALILVIAIISIIAVSSKTKLSILPKY